MTVAIIKMTSGDELIANLDSKDEHSITISKPRQLVISGDRGGLMPYIISSPDASGIVMQRHAIAAMFEAPKDVADGYLQSTTSIILG